MVSRGRGCFAALGLHDLWSPKEPPALFFVTEWRGGNQAGDKHAEEVLPSPEYCYILWGFCKEKSCRPRWSALGKCLVSFLLIRFTAPSLEFQHAWLGLCLSEALKSLFWRITYKREKLLLPRHLPSLWFPLRMGIKYVTILVTAAVILICCLNLFFFQIKFFSNFFLLKWKSLSFLPSLILVDFLSFFQTRKKKGSRGIGNKEKKNNESSNFFGCEIFDVLRQNEKFQI